MTEGLGFLTLDCKVQGLNPTEDGIKLNTAQCFIAQMPALVSQSNACLTGDQDVMAILAGPGNILWCSLIIKYFLLSVSPFI